MDDENKYVLGVEPDRSEVIRRFGELDKKFQRDRRYGENRLKGMLQDVARRLVGREA